MGEGYGSWAAIAAAIKASAKAGAVGGRSVNEVLASAMFDRLLSRVFSDGADSGWLLKGGGAMLARIPTARHTTDIDLGATAGTLDQATEALAATISRDIGDHLTFQVSASRSAGKGDSQPGVEIRRLVLTATEPGRPKIIAQVPVDLVTAAPPVGQILTVDPANRFQLPKPLPVNPYRLYPMVDHIADKVCATMTTYPGGRPSSRVKDLVDLALIARTQTVDLDELRLAITTKRALSRLPASTAFTIPDGWHTKYHLLASRIPELAGLADITAALSLVTAMINPALDTTNAPGNNWHPHHASWTETSSPPVPAAETTPEPGRGVHVRAHTRQGRPISQHHRTPRHH